MSETMDAKQDALRGERDRAIAARDRMSSALQPFVDYAAYHEETLSRPQPAPATEPESYFLVGNAADDGPKIVADDFLNAIYVSRGDEPTIWHEVYMAAQEMLVHARWWDDEVEADANFKHRLDELVNHLAPSGSKVDLLFSKRQALRRALLDAGADREGLANTDPQDMIRRCVEMIRRGGEAAKLKHRYHELRDALAQGSDGDYGHQGAFEDLLEYVERV